MDITSRCGSRPVFVALDFETANASPESACAIGVAVVEGDEVTRTLGRLIRPPSNLFSEWNFRVHGIDWTRVQTEPDFASVWASILPGIEKADFFVAHNAGFDERVLKACCEHYGLEIPDKDFVCTLEVASTMWQLDSYSLARVAQYLRIPLEHHRADSDAVASAEILLRAMADGYSLKSSRFSSVIEWAAQHYSAEVNAVAAAIMADGKVEPAEVVALSRWLATHHEASAIWPGSELARLVSTILSDGRIEERELVEIRDLCSALLGIKERRKSTTGRRRPGAIAVCFTGFGARKEELQSEAEAAGVHVAKSVIKDLDFLVTGPIPGPTKLKKAGDRNVRVVSLDEWHALLAECIRR